MAGGGLHARRVGEAQRVVEGVGVAVEGLPAPVTTFVLANSQGFQFGFNFRQIEYGEKRGKRFGGVSRKTINVGV